MFDYTDVYSAEDDDENELQVKEIDATVAKPTKSPTLPGAHTIERFLVDEQLHIILETMHLNRTMWCVPIY